MMEQTVPNVNFQTDSKQPNVNYVELVKEIWKRRKFIAFFVGSITLLAIIIVLLLPNKYTSTATLLPEMGKSRMALSGLSDLAAMAGVNVGGEVSLAKLYPTIIQSETVLRKVILKKYKVKGHPDSVNLVQFWEIKEKTPELSFETALKRLQKELKISSDAKINTVTLSIETTDAQLSADIINTTIHELNNFLLSQRTTNASEQRKWIEKRLQEVKQDLERSENTLKEFRERNRIVTGSPQLMLEQERLAREVQINSTLYVELKKQHEIARIEEIRSVPIINVLDYARPAAKKSSPKRVIVIIGIFFIAFFGSVLYMIINIRYMNMIVYLKKQMNKISS